MSVSSSLELDAICAVISRERELDIASASVVDFGASSRFDNNLDISSVNANSTPAFSTSRCAHSSLSNSSLGFIIDKISTPRRKKSNSAS